MPRTRRTGSSHTARADTLDSRGTATSRTWVKASSRHNSSGAAATRKGLGRALPAPVLVLEDLLVRLGGRGSRGTEVVEDL